MLTGIIEKQGIIKQVLEKGGNRSFWIESPLSPKLKVDQSVSHDGVCLTVEEVKSGKHRVTAIAETLSKTTLGSWEKGKKVNLERCLKMNGRLDGHFVQGHVDGRGTCTLREEKDGSWLYRFQFDPAFAALVIEKGSITINGISLTAFQVSRDQFEVAIIPFTFKHTNISDVNPGDTVNLEFDVIGKYMLRRIELGN
ncbi:MAG: riboflavin synthase [Sphingobacteriales bacterium 12-47-4]|nr:MAG: riboflavin synthase [Sphingobacteriales bacterium 12-47-4]